MDTITTISPILKLSKYMKQKPKEVPDFRQIPARNATVERCHTVDDTSKKIIKLEKIERLNVTPASGLKSKSHIQYTEIPKKRLFKLPKEKPLTNTLVSSQEPAQKRGSKHVYSNFKSSKKDSQIMYNKPVLKKTKKSKTKKQVTKKKKGSKKLVTLRDIEESKIGSYGQRNLGANHTFDGTINSKQKNDPFNPINLLEEIQGLRNKKLVSDHSKGAKSFIQHYQAIADKYCKPNLRDKSPLQLKAQDIYKRKCSAIGSKPLQITVANKKQSKVQPSSEKKSTIINYQELCQKLKQPNFYFAKP
jgi:hypothetical protein